MFIYDKETLKSLIDEDTKYIITDGKKEQVLDFKDEKELVELNEVLNKAFKELIKND